MSDFLAEMVAAARDRAAGEGDAAAGEVDEATARPGAAGRLRTALERGAARSGLALIAEVKRASPSRGAIAPTLDAAAQAGAYATAGADAISVLTEPSRFGGSLADLSAATAVTGLPALRKDFIVDVRQIDAAAARGAAAVLLIAAALTDAELAALLAACPARGLDALVEVHDEDDLERTLGHHATLVGINNRDLRTLYVDPARTERLIARIPQGVLVVAESGVRTAADARRLEAAGADALLVGEALVAELKGGAR